VWSNITPKSAHFEQSFSLDPPHRPLIALGDRPMQQA